MSDQNFKELNKTNKFLNFLKEKSKTIIILLLAILVVIIGIFLLNLKENRKNTLLSEQYNNAKILINEKKTQEALIVLIDIIKEENKFYSPLSLNTIIESELTKKDDEIVSLFNKVLAIKKINTESKNLIRIKKALFIIDKANEVEIINLLNPIVNSNSIWRPNAIKLLVEYFSYKGDKIKSEEYYNLLKN